MVKQTSRKHRHHVRAKRILSIQYKLAKGQKKTADKAWGLSTTQDISSTGVSFYSDREYGVGDILNIHVIMSGVMDIYKGYGKVVRVERKRSGICFLTAVKFVEKEGLKYSSALMDQWLDNQQL